MSDDIPVIDTHQHMWYLSKWPVSWMKDDPMLNKDFTMADYTKAVKGCNVVQTVFLEVDSDDKVLEAETVLAMCADQSTLVSAAVLGGDVASYEFGAFAEKYAKNPYVKGFRQVLHVQDRGFCLTNQVVSNIQLLGQLGLSFDVCIQPDQLSDLVSLALKAPSTVFILDHCGGHQGLKKGNMKQLLAWQNGIVELSKLPNVVAKISGLYGGWDGGMKDWSLELQTSTMDFVMDNFPDNRVVFGGDWPVCEGSAPVADYIIKTKRMIVHTRGRSYAMKLFYENAKCWYKLNEENNENMSVQLRFEDSFLRQERLRYEPVIPQILCSLSSVEFEKGPATSSMDPESIEENFPNTFGQPLITLKSIASDAAWGGPLRVGIVLSGGCASGGHNVISGLFDAAKEMDPASQVFGYLGGPIGIVKNDYIIITKKLMAQYRNTGGFDLIGTGRDKIKKLEDKQAALKTATDMRLNGIIIIGGDDSNTNAAILAEYFASQNSSCVVIGAPKTIDGDLQNEYIETSFGYDTAVKTFSESISNIGRDSASTFKTWHFIKLMGRDASHVTLECALLTQPNITLIGEEFRKKNSSLTDLRDLVCDGICERARDGKDYGLILIPEGVISFLPGINALIQELNSLLREGGAHQKKLLELQELGDQIVYVRKLLQGSNLSNFDVLPRNVQGQLFLERDPHGNVNLSKIPTESMLIEIVRKELKSRAKKGIYAGKFKAMGHFFGYEGRSGFPSCFDTTYCYALGRVASLLIAGKKNGYMCRVFNLTEPADKWEAGGVPTTMLLNMEVRHGHNTPVIKKALVDPDGKIFSYFLQHRQRWLKEECYRFVGPMQFFGPRVITDSVPMSLYIKKGLAPPAPTPLFSKL